jgi:adenosylmethionine-8-amino-7-oxononanoate aminotransferase
MFACQEAGIDPDIICLGKALTGGTMTLAATATNAKIFEGFLSDDPDNALMHGPTYMANPLACAAANASLDLFEREPRLTQVEQIEQHLLKELAACESIDGVVDVRVKGAIGVVELEASKMDKIWLREKFVERGVWLRPLKNVVYILPALNIEQADLSRLTSAVKDVLQEWSKR